MMTILIFLLKLTQQLITLKQWPPPHHSLLSLKTYWGSSWHLSIKCTFKWRHSGLFKACLCCPSAEAYGATSLGSDMMGSMSNCLESMLVIQKVCQLSFSRWNVFNVFQRQLTISVLLLITIKTCHYFKKEMDQLSPFSIWMEVWR